MSEEEKKAIELLEGLCSDDCINKDIVLTIVSLIKKQQKEIEKYKNVIDNKEFTWKQKYEETFEYVKENYINKDKIREKIKGLENIIEWEKPTYKETLDYTIDILNDLLEEK